MEVALFQYGPQVAWPGIWRVQVGLKTGSGDRTGLTY